MAEQASQNNGNSDANNANKKFRKSPEVQPATTSHVLMRERSFIRNNQQNINKRRSMNYYPSSQQHQMRNNGKPAMEIYRPPNVRIDGNSLINNKLNVNAQEFTLNHTVVTSQQSPPVDSILQNQIRSSIIFPTTGNPFMPQGKSNAASLQQMQNHLASAAAIASRYPVSNQHQHINFAGNPVNHRPILVSHPTMISMTVPTAIQQSHIPVVNSPSGGNILHNQHRVKFAIDSQPNKNANIYQNPINQQQNQYHYNNYQQIINPLNTLQRSKSLSSADILTRGIANLGLGLGLEENDIGQFKSDIQNVIDKAIDDPNQLNARSLMDLAMQLMQRAIEGRRFALPISRLCISIIAKETNETFLEALLNTCRQWYQEREKILYTIQGMKSPSRTRFTAFMAFLTEMYCQLRRRQLQLRTQHDGSPPPLVILILLARCCEDCVKPPVRSLSEIECLFFVLTCIGRDLEQQLPQQLEILLSSVRDAFLNSAASAPAIRRTLLQLIELQASRWQLPGNTVLYYYPSNK